MVISRILERGDLSPLFARTDGASGSSLVSYFEQTRRLQGNERAAMNRRTPKTNGPNVAPSARKSCRTPSRFRPDTANPRQWLSRQNA
jgi:hypothetical protein